MRSSMRRRNSAEHVFLLRRGHARLAVGRAEVVRQVQRVQRQLRGFVERVVEAVAEGQPGRVEAAGAVADQVDDRAASSSVMRRAVPATAREYSGRAIIAARRYHPPPRIAAPPRRTRHVQSHHRLDPRRRARRRPRPVGRAALVRRRARRRVPQTAGGDACSPAARAAGVLAAAVRRHAAGAGELQGHWTLVFLGFTHCPDVCPTTLAELAQAQKQWARAARRRRGRACCSSRSIPERDTPRCASANTRTPSTATRSPPPPTCRALEAFARVAVAGLHEGAGADGAPATSTASTTPPTLVVLDPQGRMAGVIQPPLDPQAIAADLRALTQAPRHEPADRADRTCCRTGCCRRWRASSRIRASAPEATG